MHFIDLQAQQNRIRAQIDAAIKRVLDHGRYVMGPEVYALQRQLAEYVGVRHAIACSSGTDALLLALLANEVGPGDAVFTSPFNFFASCEMIARVGATPVFVDINPDTYNIDPVLLEEAIERVIKDGRFRVRGIIPVDLFGLPADYEAIMSMAEKHGMFVIEDAAQAFGAKYQGQTAPALGHIGITSFFPAKPLGCYGDGGAVFTDNDALAERIRSLAVHGKGAEKYNNVTIGMNARLDTIQAAILLEKLKIYDEEMELRQMLARRFSEALAPLSSDLVLPGFPAGSVSTWAQYTIRSRNRNELQRQLQALGVCTRIYYQKPMHLLKAMEYLGYKAGDFPAAERASREVLSLPFYPYMARADLDKVVRALFAAVLQRVPPG